MGGGCVGRKGPAAAGDFAKRVGKF